MGRGFRVITNIHHPGRAAVAERARKELEWAQFIRWHQEATRAELADARVKAREAKAAKTGSP